MPSLLVAVVGLTILGVALGFLGAVSIGMMWEDRKGSLHSLRDGGGRGRLSRAGRRVVGLSVRDGGGASASSPRQARVPESDRRDW